MKRRWRVTPWALWASILIAASACDRLSLGRSGEGRLPLDAAAAPVLPSWNEGNAKRTILGFVERVTSPNGRDHVPPSDRVAVFDLDGTLWVEKPRYPQAELLFWLVQKKAPEHPEWRGTEPFRSVLARDSTALDRLKARDWLDLSQATLAHMTEDEFAAAAGSFLTAATHPRFEERRFPDLVYLPMLELVRYLQAKDFKVFVCSGSWIDFIRVFSESWGIPRENVIGSSPTYRFEETPRGWRIFRDPPLASLNTREGKPENIALHVGRRPILAFGNSDVDVEMLLYTSGGTGPSLSLVLRHDDADREYEYGIRSGKLREAALRHGWTVVSMKNDFARVFELSPEPR